MIEEQDRGGPERVLEGLTEGEHELTMPLHVLLLLFMVVFFMIILVLLRTFLLAGFGRFFDLLLRLLLILLGCLGLGFFGEAASLLAQELTMLIL